MLNILKNKFLNILIYIYTHTHIIYNLWKRAVLSTPIHLQLILLYHVKVLVTV